MCVRPLFLLGSPGENSAVSCRDWLDTQLELSRDSLIVEPSDSGPMNTPLNVLPVLGLGKNPLVSRFFWLTCISNQGIGTVTTICNSKPGQAISVVFDNQTTHQNDFAIPNIVASLAHACLLFSFLNSVPIEPFLFRC